MKKIIDEFTDLKVSNQRKHMLRLRRDNLEKYREIRNAEGHSTQFKYIKA